MSARHVWSEADDARLRQGYGRESAASIAAALGLSVPAIYCRVTKLGLVEAHGRTKPKRDGRPLNPNSSWSRMSALLADRGDQGMSLAEAAELLPQMPRKTVNNTLNRLTVEGRAVKWGGGKACSPRYFATAVHREAWEAANPQRVAAAGQARATAWTRRLAPEAPAGGAARLPGEPVTTERTRRIEAPKPQAYRHEVRGPVVGGFKTTGIGRYQEPASGWAAALTGGQRP